MDFSIFVNEYSFYLQGAWTTVHLVGTALILGLFIAIPAGIICSSQCKILKVPVHLYMYFFRGTPLLIQLFIIYYGSGQFEALRDSWLWEYFQEAWFCALLALTLNTGAYTAEIVRGVIVTMPKGELEAAKAYGMSAWLILKRITLPNALRRALPVYSNEIIFMIHGSAITGLVTIVDITGAARVVNSRYYAPFEAYLAAAVLYMCLTFSVIYIFKRWEMHYAQS
ncbi:polar amino acid ABC transporter inner membrane protein [Psychromonas sp. CNPT3]|uniref:ABC transporter permease n=1 Tax=Psychromonas sp. CNPT3 TaxID=314282 RepID=UPI00006E80E8|nr:ABC transporter permease [Psychromonas sp. CNPT3]AGH81750.1 polar amino acid ABC transporter inner membrane protein [Psychromonas sp. CNPT3]